MSKMEIKKMKTPLMLKDLNSYLADWVEKMLQTK